MPTEASSELSGESKRGLGLGAVFVGRQRFAVLDKTYQVKSYFLTIHFYSSICFLFKKDSD